MGQVCARRQAIDALKVIAIFMVLNSHLDFLYPIPALAAGGAAGNSLFFIISGFFCSIQRSKKAWILNKFIRLYLSVWILILLKCFCTRFPNTVSEFVAVFIWPTNFWFISALMAFYLIFFIMKVVHVADNIKTISILFLVIYFAVYFIWVVKENVDVEKTSLRLIYGFYTFLLGTWLKKNYNRIAVRANILLSCGVIVFLGSMVFRLLWRKGLVPVGLQFLSQFMNIVFAFAMLVAFLKYEELYSLKAGAWFKKWINFLSSISLEMYIVQFDVIDRFLQVKFPVNVAGTVIFTIALAAILNQISLKITHFGKWCYRMIVT